MQSNRFLFPCHLASQPDPKPFKRVSAFWFFSTKKEERLHNRFWTDPLTRGTERTVLDKPGNLLHSNLLFCDDVLCGAMLCDVGHVVPCCAMLCYVVQQQVKTYETPCKKARPQNVFLFNS